MPNWKKVIVSGSDAELNNLVVSNITASGNVGIGTSTPQYDLHINPPTGNASLMIQSENSFTSELLMYFQGYNNNNEIWKLYGSSAESTAGLSFNTNAFGDVMTLRGNGNVGIGTTSPSTKLHVNGTISGSTSDISGSTRSGNSPSDTHEFTGSIKISNIAGSTPLEVKGLYTDFRSGTDAGNELRFRFQHGNGGNASRLWMYDASEVLKIQLGSDENTYFNNSSNFGIGTSNPTTKLQVVGTVSASKFETEGQISASLFSGSFYGDGSNLTGISPFPYTGDAQITGSLIVSSSNLTQFQVGDSLFYISGSGNIGIGTTTPTRALDVSGQTRFGQNLGTNDGGWDHVFTANSGNALAVFKESYASSTDRLVTIGNNDNQGSIFILNGSGTATFYLRSSAASYINNGYNFGIGTTTPSTELHVVGTISASKFETEGQISASLFSGSFVGNGSTLTNISGSSLYDNVHTYKLELGVSSTSAITTGAKGRKTIPYLGTIIGWRLVADQTSTVQLDVWKRNNAIPTVADSIVASAYPALEAAELNSSTTLTGWTTSVSPNDVFILNVDSNDNATYLALELDILLT